MRDAAARFYDDAVGGELAQSRADVARGGPQPGGDLLGGEPIGTAAQDLDDAICEFRGHWIPEHQRPIQIGAPIGVLRNGGAGLLHKLLGAVRVGNPAAEGRSPILTGVIDYSGDSGGPSPRSSLAESVRPDTRLRGFCIHTRGHLQRDGDVGDVDLVASGRTQEQCSHALPAQEGFRLACG